VLLDGQMLDEAVAVAARGCWPGRGSRAVTELVAEGPCFDDLAHGDVFDTAPPAALTDGAAAVHAAIVGERLRLALDPLLGRAVTGEDRPPAPPSLVWDLAIGSRPP
jgi:hypothetical protein